MWKKLGYLHVKRFLEVAAVQGGSVMLISDGAPDVARYFRDVARDRLGLKAFVYSRCACGLCSHVVRCKDRASNIVRRLSFGKWDYAIEVQRECSLDIKGREPLVDLIHRASLAATLVKNVSSDMGKEAREFLGVLVKKLNPTPIEQEGLIKIAKSIAALDDSEFIRSIHLAEATGYWPRYVATSLLGW